MLRPILKAEDLKGGCSYLKITLTSGLPYAVIEVVTPMKKPYLHEFDTPGFGKSWFSRCRMHLLGDDYQFLNQKFCLQDANVVPNRYNDTSIWKHDMKTEQFLQKVRVYDDDAIKQYPNILARFKRGHNYDKYVRKDEESIAA